VSSASFSITSFEKDKGTKTQRDESSRLQRKGNGHFFFGNIRVAARKLSEQIKLQNCGRHVNSGRFSSWNNRLTHTPCCLVGNSNLGYKLKDFGSLKRKVKPLFKICEILVPADYHLSCKPMLMHGSLFVPHNLFLCANLGHCQPS
jgi:hypothetical protein